MIFGVRGRLAAEDALFSIALFMNFSLRQFHIFSTETGGNCDADDEKEETRRPPLLNASRR
jgi:hypothetical protein